MAGNSAFIPVAAQGWRGGLENLLRAEMGKWWRTSMWWIQALIWTAAVNGPLMGVLWAEDGGDVNTGILLYCLFTGLFPTIAIAIILQDALVGEKQSGTAAWVLSKPVSRAAFVLSKLFANMSGTLATMVLLPGLVAYIQLSLAGDAWLNPVRFTGGMGVLWLHMLFYITLTLMLGAIFNHGAAVIGIPLALAFGQQMLIGMLPFLASVLPWNVVMPLNDGLPSIASTVILGEAHPNLMPFYVMCAAIVVFTAVCLWRFERQEL